MPYPAIIQAFSPLIVNSCRSFIQKAAYNTSAQAGTFCTHMLLEILNDGPVTIVMER
jgi:D-Tyr-tRNAtyr deacylase